MAMTKRDRGTLASLAATVDKLAALHPSNPADTKQLFRYAAIRTKVLPIVHLALSDLAFGDPDKVAAEWADDAARHLRAALDDVDQGRND